MIGPNPSELSSEAAFRIFPIAHQYEMRTILVWCSGAVGKATLDLWPSAPIASSQVPKHPGLVQWLALADAKQCAPLVETCLSQLLCQESNDAIHEAAASPHLSPLIDGLRPETKTSIIYQMAGMPLGFQVLITPVKLQASVAACLCVSGDTPNAFTTAPSLPLLYLRGGR